jgi:hypothetical protein
LNDEEARLLSGDPQVPRAARRLLDEGVKRLLVKKGEHGALLFGKNDRFFCPAYPHEDLVDPTERGRSPAGSSATWITWVGDRHADPPGHDLRHGAGLALRRGLPPAAPGRDHATRSASA